MTAVRRVETWPSIDAALAPWPAAQRRAAHGVLELALADFPNSGAADPGDPDPGGSTWTASKLGRRGFPLEMTFKDGGGELRYTVEVDRPDRPADTRIARLLEVAASVGEPDWPRSVVETLQDLHARSGDELTYGAWLGVRHRADRGDVGEPGLKLYAELPTAAAAWVRSVEECWGFSTWGGARPVMLGVEAGRLELYYQANAPRVGELPSVLGRAGFGDGAAARLRTPLERAYGLSLDRGLPAPRVGWSYGLAQAPGDGVETITLYQPADTVFGGDRAIRRRWMELHGDDSRYASVSGPLDAVGGRGGALHHGLYGVVVPRSGDAVSALGLTPPAVH